MSSPTRRRSRVEGRWSMVGGLRNGDVCSQAGKEEEEEKTKKQKKNRKRKWHMATCDGSVGRQAEKRQRR